MTSANECAVCFNLFDDGHREQVTLVPCNHTEFCKSCILFLFETHPSPKCPLCRQNIVSLENKKGEDISYMIIVQQVHIARAATEEAEVEEEGNELYGAYLNHCRWQELRALKTCISIMRFDTNEFEHRIVDLIQSILKRSPAMPSSLYIKCRRYLEDCCKDFANFPLLHEMYIKLERDKYQILYDELELETSVEELESEIGRGTRVGMSSEKRKRKLQEWRRNELSKMNVVWSMAVRFAAPTHHRDDLLMIYQVQKRYMFVCSKYLAENEKILEDLGGLTKGFVLGMRIINEVDNFIRQAELFEIDFFLVEIDDSAQAFLAELSTRRLWIVNYCAR